MEYVLYSQCAHETICPHSSYLRLLRPTQKQCKSRAASRVSESWVPEDESITDNTAIIGANVTGIPNDIQIPSPRMSHFALSARCAVGLVSPSSLTDECRALPEQNHPVRDQGRRPQARPRDEVEHGESYPSLKVCGRRHSSLPPPPGSARDPEVLHHGPSTSAISPSAAASTRQRTPPSIYSGLALDGPPSYRRQLITHSKCKYDDNLSAVAAFVGPVICLVFFPPF
ncbi:hypothetical protein C8R44DRAFT_819651 [Mycena epipterygia]|nr:hypothetical protein C8R44DRAFT_819651 [Mycena epipterygia]